MNLLISVSRMNEITTIRNNLVLQGNSIVFAYCKTCKRIVEPTEKMHCPNGRFHILKKKIYFDLTEKDSINQ